MPRLRDLDASFLAWEERMTDVVIRKPDGSDVPERQMREFWQHVDALAEAHGVMFLCPLCFQTNGGPVGTHSVVCWFVGKVPDHADPKPGRWIPAGTGIDDLTFIGPAAASVLLTSGCGWHGFVKNGSAE